MDTDIPDTRVLLLGAEVFVRSTAERDALLSRIVELEGLAAQGRQVPELLARLDVSERRFSQIRRILRRATDAVAEATSAARTDLDLDDAPKAKTTPFHVAQPATVASRRSTACKTRTKRWSQHKEAHHA